jgi:hypothetical protein
MSDIGDRAVSRIAFGLDKPSYNMTLEKQKAEEEKEKYRTASGATSSRLKLRFDLVPEIFNVRIAQRYTFGAEKHGEYNYRKGLTDPSYLQERIAHLRSHLSDFLLNGNTNDDNLAAIGWCVSFLMEAEQIPAGKKALLQALNVMNYAPMEEQIGDGKDGKE